MGISGGPNIVKTNLAVNLDATDRNSYTTGSTTWIDLSGNSRNFTLTNGPSFDTGSGGSIRFDGVNDYATLNIASDTPMKIENFIFANHTYEIWFNLGSLSPSFADGTEVAQALLCWPGWHNFSGFVQLTPTSSVSLYSNHLYNSTRTDQFVTLTNITGSSITTGSWFCIHDIIDYTNTKSYTYINGVQLSMTASVPVSSMASSNGIPANVINIGAARGTTDYKFFLQNGRISAVRLYNKALTAEEVSQNYNMQKTKYGR